MSKWPSLRPTKHLHEKFIIFEVLWLSSDFKEYFFEEAIPCYKTFNLTLQRVRTTVAVGLASGVIGEDCRRGSKFVFFKSKNGE